MSVRKASTPAPGSRTRILSGVDVFKFTIALLTHPDYHLILAPRGATVQGNVGTWQDHRLGHTSVRRKNLKNERGGHVVGID